MFRVTRRKFMGAAVSAVGAGLVGVGSSARASPVGSGGGLFPGKGVTVWHPEATSGRTVNVDAVQLMIDRGLASLAGDADPVVALEHLLPGLTTGSQIVIKVNLIAGPTHCWTRWELVQALIARLTETLGGTFPAGNITVFDQHDLPSHGYTAEHFPGVVLSSDNECTSGVMMPTPGQQSELSRFIAGADFIINFPVVKNHYANLFTLGMKNHYGSIAPSSWCGDFDALLAINAFSEIKQKTALVMLDGLFGNFVSDVDGGPDGWPLFPGGTPRRVFLSTDPCVIEHLGQSLINEQRQALNLAPLADHYLYRAGDPPYELGVADPASMDLSFVDASLVSVTDHPSPGRLQIGPASPNPFRDSTQWAISVSDPGVVQVSMVDMAGRRVTVLHQGFLDRGTHATRWNGRRDDGARVPAGTYLLVVHGGGRGMSSPVTLLP